MTKTYLIILLLITLCFVGCKNAGKNGSEEICEDSVVTCDGAEEAGKDSVIVKNQVGFWRQINSVDAHDERDTIVGNFTGKGIDTLFVVRDPTKEEHEEGHFYIKSNNAKIPKVNLWGITIAPPKLVNEGDLDGNGTCEVGYLPTWDVSQWRTYYIFTLVNYQWCYLVCGEYLDTSECFRHTGVDIAEKGPNKGEVLIHYASEGVNESNTERIYEIKDTIVRPLFIVIDD